MNSYLAKYLCITQADVTRTGSKLRTLDTPVATSAVFAVLAAGEGTPTSLDAYLMAREVDRILACALRTQRRLRMCAVGWLPEATVSLPMATWAAETYLELEGCQVLGHG